MKPLAQIIQRHRKKAGLSQAKLARLAGVGKTVVWDIENGKESVQWKTLLKIFRVLDITAEWRSPLIEREAIVSASASSPAASAAQSTSAPTSSPDSSSVTVSRTPA